MKPKPLKGKLKKDLEILCLLRWDKSCDVDRYVNAINKIEIDVKSAVEWLKERIVLDYGLDSNLRIKLIDLIDNAFEDVINKGEKG